MLNQHAGIEAAGGRHDQAQPGRASASPETASASSAGDTAGFPNGRRLGDDVVDIELQVGAGFLKGSKVPLGDGVDQNDKPFLSSFPYLASPHDGFDSAPSTRIEPGHPPVRRAASPDRDGGGSARPALPRSLAEVSQMTLSPPNLIKLLGPARRLRRGPGSADGGERRRRAGAPRSPPTRGPFRRRRRDFQRAVRAAPGSAPAYAGLGDAYLARARETGDPSFYSRAERAFDAALRRDPGDLGALIGAGTLAGLRHDFGEQLRLARMAVAEAPDLARPYTVLADAQVELGRYDDAARSIQRLVDAKPGLASYSRASYFRELSGDPAGAVAAMRLATSAGGAPRAWRTCRSCSATSSSERGRVRRRPARTRGFALPAGLPGRHGRTRASGHGGRRSGGSRRPPAPCRRACCR